ncbi:alpha/beta hydrolase [Aquimarina pacifica]|uniref:alpha/beta hydrolase n=1 Tax=Aquimarina pacifica TaxID=1296415 RepID=UPI000472D586|nr:alpha/beta fold hydrolase [Aquimarina pacifica]
MKEKYKKKLPVIIGKYIQFLFFFNKKKALRKAYVLFCTPRKGSVLPEQEYFLEEAEDEVVLVKDVYVQTYRWSGMGETVLLVHGWESNSFRWRELIEKLQRQGYNVIAYDAPAHGNSSGKIFNIPLNAECLQKIIELYRPNYVIGHSMGGMTTIFHQYIHSSQEIDRLIMLAPPSELSRMVQEYQQVLRFSTKFMKALDQYFKEKHGFYFDEFSSADFSKKITIKGLLIHDKLDDITPYTEAEAISTHWKNVTLVPTEGFGHSLFFPEVDRMILDFLKD